MIKDLSLELYNSNMCKQKIRHTSFFLVFFTMPVVNFTNRRFFMKTEGRCYCGIVKYEIEEKAEASFQCHCRECQYITGGSPNTVMAFPKESFNYVSGRPKKFTRQDIDLPVTRHFCENCGTAIGTESPARPNSMIVKVGTMDNPSAFRPQAAIFTCDTQPFHHLPDGIPLFEKRPPKKQDN